MKTCDWKSIVVIILSRLVAVYTFYVKQICNRKSILKTILWAFSVSTTFASDFRLHPPTPFQWDLKFLGPRSSHTGHAVHLLTGSQYKSLRENDLSGRADCLLLSTTAVRICTSKCYAQSNLILIYTWPQCSTLSFISY